MAVRQSRLALAREAAARCCVLLKNDANALPLQAKGAKVALIGPCAQDRGDLLGCWEEAGKAADVVSMEEGLIRELGRESLVVAKGCDLSGNDTSGFAAALDAARQADVVVLALGESSGWSGERHSRQDQSLPGVQEGLFDQVLTAGKPVVVVLFAGRPLAIPHLQDNAAAIVMAWHPGVQAGPGVADVLFDRGEPQGRLSAIFPRSVGQLPVYYNNFSVGRLDYKDGSRQPLYPFGFGLSYTQFSLGATRLAADHILPGDSIVVAAPRWCNSICTTKLARSASAPSAN